MGNGTCLFGIGPGGYSCIAMDQWQAGHGYAQCLCLILLQTQQNLVD